MKKFHEGKNDKKPVISDRKARLAQYFTLEKKNLLLSIELIHDPTVEMKAPIEKNSTVDFICYTQFHQRIVATHFVKNIECTFYHIQLLSLMSIRYK